MKDERKHLKHIKRTIMLHLHSYHGAVSCPTRVSGTRILCNFKNFPCIHVSCPYQSGCVRVT